jgi:hypothetical protein
MINKTVVRLVSVLVYLVVVVPVLAESESWEAAVSAANPLNWYKLNEMSGTVAFDYGSAGVNGVYGDAVELSQPGLVGMGAYLGGTGNGIKVVYLNQEKLEGDWTAEFIVKATTLPTESILLCQEAWGYIKLCQTMEFAGQIGYTLKGSYDAGLGYVLPLEEWHHIVFVMTETEGMKLYVDGVLEGQSEQYLQLIRQYLGGQETRDEMDGIVDEAVLYDRPLLQDEIEAHADAAFGVVRPRAVINPTLLELAEPGSDTYRVVMSSAISSDVSIVVDPNVHGNLLAVSSGVQNPGYGERITLTFTPSDWDQEQVVSVTSLEDGVNLGLNNATIKHLVSSSDPNVRDRAMDVSVKIIDDDSANCEGAFLKDDFNDGLIDPAKWARVDATSSARGLTEEYNVLNVSSGSYALAEGDWPVFRMTGISSAYDGTMGMFIRSDGSAGSGVRLEFWPGGIGTEWQDNVLTIMSGGRAITYANQAWAGEKFDFASTNFYWEVIDDGLTVTFRLEQVGNPSNNTIISAELPGVRQGRKILLGCDEWGSSADCWYDDVCIFSSPVLVEETGEPARTAVFENSLSGPTLDSYTIALDELPDDIVTVTATVMDPNTNPGYVGSLVTLREAANPGNAGYSIEVVLDSGNWQDGVLVEVLSIDDSSVEGGPHTATVVHEVASGDIDFAGAFAAAVDAVIYDDESAYVLIDELNGIEVSEADEMQVDSYNVQLLGEPSADVYVQVLGNAEQIVAEPGELTFTVDQWWTVQGVEVSAVDDEFSGDEAEGDPHSTMILHTASGAGEYAVLEIDSAAVSILDNDCGSWPYQVMDFDLDCDVDISDFAEFASSWMSCTTPYAPGCVRIE